MMPGDDRHIVGSETAEGRDLARVPIILHPRLLRPRPGHPDAVRGAQRAGVFPREQDCPVREKPEKVFHVYITASGPRGVLYVGMTSDLAARAWQHRERVRGGFTRWYWVDRLVYFEPHDASVAARRERSMKRWRRDWKIELIERHNPTWRDLFADVVQADGFEW
jgi:putative endonuclease